MQFPGYCWTCGVPYPWTVSALRDAYDLIRAEKNLSYEEQEAFIQNLQDVLDEKPHRVAVATENAKRLAQKAGPALGQALISILANVGSETLMKILALK